MFEVLFIFGAILTFGGFATDTMEYGVIGVCLGTIGFAGAMS